MKGQTRFPLWLVCDPSAAIRLALAMWMLTWCIPRYWPKTRPPTRKGAATVSLALCCAEALLRWAIIRQVLRCCGLDPSTARLFQLPLADNSFTWLARCRTFIRLVSDMTFYARRWARRIRDNDDDAADPTPAIRATMTILANSPGAASRRHAHVAIRGPPRRPATRNTPRPRLADPSARSRAIVRYAMR